MTIPRCTHGNILLGCPRDDCDEQNAYIETSRAAYEVYYQEMSCLKKLIGTCSCHRCMEENNDESNA